MRWTGSACSVHIAKCDNYTVLPGSVCCFAQYWTPTASVGSTQLYPQGLISHFAKSFKNVFSSVCRRKSRSTTVVSSGLSLW